MKIVDTLASDGAFAAYVERADRVNLSCVRLTNDHPVLLLDVGIGCRCLHAAELKRWPPILVEIRQDRRSFHGLDRKPQRRLGPNGTGGRRNVAAVLRQQKAPDAVIGAGAN